MFRLALLIIVTLLIYQLTPLKTLIGVIPIETTTGEITNPIMPPLQFSTVPARTKATATVVFSHGLGDSGHGWKSAAEFLSRELPHIKFILPHAPSILVSVNGGTRMPAWFDKASSLEDVNGAVDETGMLNSVRAINDIVSAEVDAGTPSDRIVVGGFSQGAALSLLTGLMSERKLGGVVVLSGWLPLRQKFPSMMSSHATSRPLFWGHGTADSVVRYDFARGSVDLLYTLGFPKSSSSDQSQGVTVNLYEQMGHTADIQELQDLKAWLKVVLPEA